MFQGKKTRHSDSFTFKRKVIGMLNNVINIIPWDSKGAWQMSQKAIVPSGNCPTLKAKNRCSVPRDIDYRI